MFSINYAGVLSDNIGIKDGITRRELEYFTDQFDGIYKEFLKEHRSFGFCEIIKDKNLIKEAKSFYNSCKHFENVVVLGIGGSALGAKAIQNIIPVSSQKTKVFVLDNIDPFTLSNFFEQLNFEKTLFLVISKSGETVETLSQFMYCYGKIKQLQLDPLKHFVLITDPEKGFLRKLAKEEGFLTFPVPSKIGGRFSVLSLVGLLPAVFIGADVEKILDGARYIEKKCLEQVFSFSLLLYLLNVRRNKKNVVMMPYCDRLIEFSLWFSQLWAESLGKKYGLNGEVLRTGQTPIVARGVTDQHSQLQLYLEGPKDKIIVLLKSNEKNLLQIPHECVQYDNVNYLCGKAFDDLFEAEYTGTYGALIKESVPVIKLECDKLDDKTLGGLFYFFELCTAFSGKLYGINPFDQPGVEIGKKIAFGLLGKKGFDIGDFKLSLEKLNERIVCD